MCREGNCQEHEPIAPEPSKPRSPAPYLVAILFLVYSVYSLTRYSQFLVAGYDLGIFDQAVRAYAHFQPPMVPLKGEDFNLLGDHFYPIVASLAPLYWVWDDARMLLLAQAALVAISAVFVWMMARRRFSSLTSSLMVITYGLGWPIQGLVDFDFHEIAFALPLLAWAINSLDIESDRQLVLACLLLLLVREDMGAIVFMIGCIRFLRRPRWLGTLLAALGAGAFVLTVGGGNPAHRW